MVRNAEDILDESEVETLINDLNSHSGSLEATLLLEERHAPLRHEGHFFQNEDSSEERTETQESEQNSASTEADNDLDTPPRKRRARRLKHPQDSTLRQFTRRTDSRLFPKKEYVRCWAIRRHRKSLGALCNIRKKRKLERELRNLTEEQVNAYWHYVHITEVELFDTSANFEAWPIVAGTRTSRRATYASHNNAFCSEYLRTPGVLESYHSFLNYFFLQDAAALSKVMNIACCAGTHDEDCDEKWLSMKHYLQFGILQELRITPPNNY